MASNAKPTTTPAPAPAPTAPVLPNRACTCGTPYTIATPNGGKAWQRYCGKCGPATTTHPLPVTTAARMLAPGGGLPWAAYVLAHGGSSNAMARSNALRWVAGQPTPTATPAAPTATPTATPAQA